MGPGKFAGAGKATGYRRVATAVGPQSTKNDYVSTYDIGKQAPAGAAGKGYRRVDKASGPESSHVTTTHTLDPGHGEFLARGGVKGIGSDTSAKASISSHDEPAHDEYVEEPAAEEPADEPADEPAEEAGDADLDAVTADISADVDLDVDVEDIDLDGDLDSQIAALEDE